MSFLVQPMRAFEFTSPVFDYIKNKFLWIKPVSSIIFAKPELRKRYTRREVNERIIEIPFVLSNLPKSGKILDVGACESPISLMLASTGYKVWANDTRPYHFPHPNLKIIVGSVTQLSQKNFFDTVICLSVLEHIGYPVYGNIEEPGQDLLAIEKMHKSLKPGGKLLLTTPIDIRHRKIKISRIYTLAELTKMLKIFKKVEIKMGYKDKKQNWVIGKRLPAKFKSFGKMECAVALVTAVK